MSEHRISRDEKFRRTPERPSWRAYQNRLRAKQKSREFLFAAIRWAVWIVPAVALLYGIGSYSIDLLSNSRAFVSPEKSATKIQTAPIERQFPLKKQHLAALLKNTIFDRLGEKRFEIHDGKRDLLVETSIQSNLQAYIHSLLDTRYASRIGVVALHPGTGSILAMVGYARDASIKNPCIDPTFPAASIFKIVTAAAAIESQGIRPDTQLHYNGRKYTLYRSQISDKKNRYTHEISLRDSFAQSINPVFGKLGALFLSPKELQTYATAFGFNQKLNFELGLPPSRVHISDNSYRRAEIACGFNRETQISPLHGAVLAASMVNGGNLVEPAIIQRISEKSGQTLFSYQQKIHGRAVKEKTAALIGELMAETIRSGTCQKAFRGHNSDKILARLNIGGKTGSIASDSPETRVDWFVGYASGKDGKKTLAVSVVVVHEKFIGIRSSEYARKVMKYYFQDASAQS